MRLLMATAAHGDTARPVAERLDGAVAAHSAHGTIASSLAISFSSRVVQEATRRSRQLIGEPRPCSSVLSIQGSSD
jgi:hypothetical protein